MNAESSLIAHIILGIVGGTSGLFLYLLLTLQFTPSTSPSDPPKAR